MSFSQRNLDDKNIIYIGAEKTSTSYLQRFLRLNREVLFDSFGVFNLGPDLNVQEIIRSVKEGKFTGEEFKSNCKSNMLVSEFFYRDLKGENIKRFSDGLKNIGFEPTVVVYVRDQVDWVKSFYSTYVKNGNLLGFDAYLDFLLSKKNISIDYFARVNLWYAAFGENLVVRTFTGESLLPHVGTDLGIELENVSNFIYPELVNSSLPVESLRMLLEINRVAIESSQIITESDRKNLKHLLVKNPIGNTRLEILNEDRVRIIDRFKEGNIGMNTKWGTELPIR